MKTKLGSALKINKNTLLIVGGMVCITLFLRIAKINDLSAFGHDTSRDLILNYKMLTYQEWIYRGPTFSVAWGFMSPLYYYMLFPFHLIGGFHPLSSPIASMIFCITASLIAFYFLFKEFSPRAGYIVLFIFSFSFLYILMSMQGLNPTLVPPFTVLAVFSMYEIFLKNKHKFLAVLAFAFSFLIALHPAGVFLIVPVIILFLIYRPRISLKIWLVSGGIFALLGVCPYLIQEKKLAWWSIKQLLEYSKEPGEKVTFIPQVFNFIESTVRNLSLGLFSSTHWIFLFIAIIIIALLIVEGTMFLKYRSKYKFIAFILLTYLVTFMFLVKFPEAKLNQKWFGAVFVPLAFIYTALLLERLWRVKGFVLYILLTVFFAVNIYAYLTYTASTDSFAHISYATEVIRDHSKGAQIDVYGLTPDTIYYLLWLREKEPARKELYLSWIKWAKEKNSKLLYFVESTYDLNPDKLQSLIDRHKIKGEYEQIGISPQGRKIYVTW